MVRIKGFVGCEVIRNGNCGFTKHIGHNGIQCHVADSKRILKTVLLTASHGCELVAVASKLSQDADVQIWDKAAFHKAKTKQITDPLGIFRIILVSLDSLYPFWIGNNDPDLSLFQNVEYRSPILSGGFHADIQAVVFQEPGGKTVQIRVKGAESLFLIVWLQTVCGSGDDGSHHKCFVNIYTAAGWKYDLHSKTSLVKNGEENAGTEPPSN